jgi:hypothetical protein
MSANFAPLIQESQRVRRRRPVLRSAILLGALAAGTLVIASAASAQTISNPALLPGGDSGANDRFGSSLAMVGDTLIVGAPRDNPNGRF